MTTIERRPAHFIRQLGTHHKLVSATEQRKAYPTLSLDAIIVPASRPARNLELAITLARAARSRLVILCSHQARPAEIHRLLAARSFENAIVIDIPGNYHHRLLDFRALASIEGELPEACSRLTTNLSIKRNLGLLIARLLGWHRIFFLDDDIRDMGYPDLQSTVSMLAQYRTAGMRVTQFPDNSAACHAHRMTGGAQDVFLSGSALAVDIKQNIGFFPNMYNEDWLFFYDDAAAGRLGSSPRKITQLLYNPFADPERAAWQEFGDVLAEGLYALLGRGLTLEHATHDYWSDFLYARQMFLKAIVRRSESASPAIRESLLRSIEAALECTVMIEPRTLERYITMWREDSRDWERRLVRMGSAASLEEALDRLGLERSADDAAGDAAQPVRETFVEDTPTTPYELRDLYELLELGDRAGGELPPENAGASNGRARSLLHHGPAGVGEINLLGAGWRGFRRGKPGYTAAGQDPAPEAAH